MRNPLKLWLGTGGCRLLVLAFGLTNAPAADSSTSAWNVVAPPKAVTKLPDLPPLAVVGQRDDSGQTWGVSGSMDGALPLAQSDFKLCFERQGWRLDKVIPMGQGRQILILWQRDDHSIILMLREVGVARTAFALGRNDDPHNAPKAVQSKSRDPAEPRVSQATN